ncbi:MAG TPA: hypothetical protein PK514_11875 [Spirochaetota bacterium]|nr:hypothetical protein [Spirochaetota bacterium]
MKYLLEHGILSPVNALSELTKGTIVRRISKSKDQQGIFLGLDDTGGLILVNVINMLEVSFETEAGILRPASSDKIYRYTTSFGKDRNSAQARDILKSWSLYSKNPEQQKAMMAFMENAYAPEQVIDLAKTDNLNYIFIPVQQRFKIGKFEEKVNWNVERKQRFTWYIDNMRKGDHITYVAFIPQKSFESPLFYSIGTKPHESTVFSLRSEPFNFKPVRGGHILCTDDSGDEKKFLVDAGSEYIGKGHKTSIDTAKEVSRALTAVYKGYAFTPVKGRGALTGEQSY